MGYYPRVSGINHEFSNLMVNRSTKSGRSKDIGLQFYSCLYTRKYHSYNEFWDQFSNKPNFMI